MADWTVDQMADLLVERKVELTEATRARWSVEQKGGYWADC